MIGKGWGFVGSLILQLFQGSTFEHHLRWHAALLQVALGNFEEALTMYDDFVGPLTLKGFD